MTRRTFLLAMTLATPVLAEPPTTAPAGPPADVDKSGYTLFHPVPDDQQRAFNPDRPSVTTGPFTVDAGHVQVEASFLQYTRDPSTQNGGDGGDQFLLLPAETRLGVLPRAEVDLTVNPYLYQRTPAAAARGTPGPGGATHGQAATPAAHTGGFGDLQLQAKVNLLGDDDGDLAFGLVPYLTLPTASSTRGLGTGRVAGGVLLPVQLNLPAGFVAAGQAEFDFPRNDADTATGFDAMQTVELTHPLVGNLDAYGEYVGVAPVALGHGYQAYADAGLTYQIGDDVQLDAAVNVGLSRDTAPYTILAGITVRR